MFGTVSFKYKTQAEWRTGITQAVNNFKARWPSVRRIDLVTQIRGPNNMLCPTPPTAGETIAVPPEQDAAMADVAAALPGLRVRRARGRGAFVLGVPGRRPAPDRGGQHGQHAACSPTTSSRFNSPLVPTIIVAGGPLLRRRRTRPLGTRWPASTSSTVGRWRRCNGSWDTALRAPASGTFQPRRPHLDHDRLRKGAIGYRIGYRRAYRPGAKKGAKEHN